MRAPAFWWKSQPGAQAIVLMPLGYIWGAIAARRLSQDGKNCDLPVICVGNFVAGGAGKTPAAIECALILQAQGWRPAFLTRGYGGSASRAATPLRVDPSLHTSAVTGDEALLLARHAPTIVSADRVAGANSAGLAGADVIVMDAGLQNPALHKNFRIAIADGETGIGNGLCIPAGPLRAPLELQLASIDALIVVGQGEAGDRIAGRAMACGVAVFCGDLRPQAEAVQRLRGRKVLAFAGIGRPEKFFSTLEKAGALVVEGYSFGDHQVLDAANLRDLRLKARQHQAQLVTTEKDIVRLKGLQDDRDIDVLPVALGLEDEARFTALMLRKIAKKSV